MFKRLVRAALLVLAITNIGCSTLPDEQQPNDSIGTIAERRLGDDVRVVALRTGWVRIKESHRSMPSPSSTRILAIMLDRDWATWMPIISYAVVTPEGVVLVDTGPPSEINDEGYLDCDERSAFFYRRTCVSPLRVTKCSSVD